MNASTTQSTSMIGESATANRRSLLSHELITEIAIEAPTDIVWTVLTDLDDYKDWNPFVVEAAGDVREGATLSVRIQPVGGRASDFESTITEVASGRSFEWRGRLILPQLFEGRHRFDLEPTADGTGTRFRQSESFSGLLVPLLVTTLNRGTLQGFVQMNEALKARAEATVGSR